MATSVEVTLWAPHAVRVADARVLLAPAHQLPVPQRSHRVVEPL